MSIILVTLAKTSDFVTDQLSDCSKLAVWSWTCTIDFCLVLFNPLPNDKILDLSKLKGFADYNFKIDENGRKFLKRVENTVGKGEIARYEQFLLSPQCFQMTYTADT